MIKDYGRVKLPINIPIICMLISIASSIEQPRESLYAAHNEDAYLQQIVSMERKEFAIYRQNGSAKANELMELLRRDARLNVDRCVIVGSVGKGTSLGVNHGSDYDIDVFLNGVDMNGEEPLEGYLKIIAEILKQSRRFKVRFVNQFVVGSEHLATGMELDVSPAVNFYEADLAWGRSPAQVQLKQVLELLSLKEGNPTNWASSVSEAVVEFVKNQPDFVRDVVIIGKLWNKFRLGSVGSYVAGRRSIVELVAIRAALDEMKRVENGYSHYLALKQFLLTLSQDMNQIHVVFDYPLPSDSARVKFNSMKSREGIILDPVNPYNNFLDGIHVRKAWQKIRTVAKQCLIELQILENRPLEEREDMLPLGKVVPTSNK